jgi:IS5 family transposase
MSFASSRAWSVTSLRRWDAGVSGGSAIGRDRRDVECKRFNGWHQGSARSSRPRHIANSSALPKRSSKAHERRSGTGKACGKDIITDLAIAELRKEIEHFCDLGVRVIDQSRRRVLNGEQVPTTEKLDSIFEPHTDLIKRGKVQTPIEFGHKVFLAESARGLITLYEVLDADANPVDEQHVVISLERHSRPSATSPNSMDRIVASSAKRMWRRASKQQGVKEVCIPQRGGTKAPEHEAYEKRREFKDGQRFRAGIEGRISVLFRCRGMKRCLAEGRERFELWVAAAVLANNLIR